MDATKYIINMGAEGKAKINKATEIIFDPYVTLYGHFFYLTDDLFQVPMPEIM